MTDDSRWYARVERDARWGPFTWHITVRRGGQSGRYSYAWTRRGATRRAARMVRRHNAADGRRDTQSFTVREP